MRCANGSSRDGAEEPLGCDGRPAGAPQKTPRREDLTTRGGSSCCGPFSSIVLELPEALVKSRLFEGMKKLREHAALLDESG